MANPLNTKKLSEMLRTKRGSKGLRDASKEIGNVSPSTLSRIEQGNLPDTDTFLRLCRWLEVSPDFFTVNSASEEPVQNIIKAHLRADRTLPKETINALIQMINLAYEQSSKKTRAQVS